MAATSGKGSRSGSKSSGSRSSKSTSSGSRSSKSTSSGSRAASSRSSSSSGRKSASSGRTTTTRSSSSAKKSSSRSTSSYRDEGNAKRVLTPLLVVFAVVMALYAFGVASGRIDSSGSGMTDFTAFLLNGMEEGSEGEDEVAVGTSTASAATTAPSAATTTTAVKTTTTTAAATTTTKTTTTTAKTTTTTTKTTTTATTKTTTTATTTTTTVTTTKTTTAATTAAPSTTVTLPAVTTTATTQTTTRAEETQSTTASAVTGRNAENVVDPDYASPYYIVVYAGKSQSVAVYSKDADGCYSVLAKCFTCSTGAPESPTTTGQYKIRAKYRWRLLYGYVYGQYSSSISPSYLFHSVPYAQEKENTLDMAEYAKLGTAASHGCIRLCVRDSKWIYDNCPIGTQVNIVNLSGPEGAGVPQLNYGSAYKGWDPSDPSSSNPYNN